MLRYEEIITNKLFCGIEYFYRIIQINLILSSLLNDCLIRFDKKGYVFNVSVYHFNGEVGNLIPF